MTRHNFFSGRNLLATLFLIGSIVFYILGVTHPLMSTKYQVIGIRLKSQEVTLFDSIRLFWDSKDYFVALIYSCFHIHPSDIQILRAGTSCYHWQEIPSTARR